MNSYLGFFLITMVFFCSGCQTIKDTKKPEWKTYFDNKKVKGTIVIRDLGSGQQWIYNQKRAEMGFLPASTFKVINSMIALETEILTTEDTLFWNGENQAFYAFFQDFQGFRRILCALLSRDSAKNWS
mgnify:CR=1 FL=1